MLSSEPMPLEYFDRTIQGTSVFYQAKVDKCFIPLEDTKDEDRYFWAAINSRGQFVVNQNPMPHNPTLPAEASLELANIYVDWLNVQKHD